VKQRSSEVGKLKSNEVKKPSQLHSFTASQLPLPSNISLFGSGKTTSSIAKWLKATYPDIKVTFYEDIQKSYIDENGFMHLSSDDFDPLNSSLEMPSPGIPPHHQLIKKAKNLISEYDLFLHLSPFALLPSPFTIWISGTNGKTTTTQMVTHLLEKKRAVSGGNIGNPLASLDKNAKIWVLETSSFTLHYTKYAKPNLYILLPISQDHISWHGDFDLYVEAKLKPIKSLKEGEVCIIPQNYKNIKTDGFMITYSSSKDLAKFFDIDIKKIEFKEPFLLDSIIALAVTKILFDECDYDLINSFKIDKHKLEEFFDNDNRLWVDDSKATNIDATIEAIKRYKDKKIYIILGGDTKGANLSPLFDFIKNLDINIFAIGKDAKRIEELSKKYNINCENVVLLENAVKKIKELLTKDDVALLSPACASLDQFKSYKDRGENFKKYVRKG